MLPLLQALIQDCKVVTEVHFKDALQNVYKRLRLYSRHSYEAQKAAGDALAEHKDPPKSMENRWDYNKRDYVPTEVAGAPANFFDLNGLRDPPEQVCPALPQLGDTACMHQATAADSRGQICCSYPV